MIKTRTHRCLLFLTMMAVLSCGSPLPRLEDVDLEAWKSDPNACSGKRTSMTGAFGRQKDKLLGLSEMEIVKLLGKPDQNELYKRNQKFYHYFFEPAAACAVPAKKPQILSIRFNAMGLAKEVAVE